MAKQVIERLLDDIDGGEAAETVTFGLDGVAYEIDLNEKNAQRLRDSLSPYVDAARRATSAPRRRRSGPRVSRERSAEIRQWAKEHGIAVSERGRIAGHIVEKFEQAHR